MKNLLILGAAMVMGVSAPALAKPDVAKIAGAQKSSNEKGGYNKIQEAALRIENRFASERRGPPTEFPGQGHGYGHDKHNPNSHSGGGHWGGQPHSPR